ncbi:cytochrome c3 family protein [Ideonella sp. A 288]|uniref:cytochrome c3 family protein n=1 Tax=Ideonella sp. A 288 TaxID=1962181 RepID=UPI000B4BA871|nr:cytochrome c3 family protein [Ideonella sp. A 288]
MLSFRALLGVCLLGLGLGVLHVGEARAARVADVSNTPHNLSVTGPGTLKATSESQICVFCHTPHAAEAIPQAPLWNRKLSAATYTTYTSSSIEASAAELAAGPGGASKLCLSCHDGTMAIGNVNVLGGRPNVSVTLQGTGPGGTMAPGEGTSTGFTRNLGVNLTNDHPISFTYNAALASADGELRVPDGTLVGTRVAGAPRPKLPLQDGQVQCTTCHDPHLRETDASKGSGKFLRLNRFQELPPTGGAFAENADLICLACHDKAGQAWAFSAHAHPDVANETYNASAAALRGFPLNQPVWKAGCLNCHDTHTVQGARRLLREGTDSTATPKSGGNPALEQTCYACHSALGQSALNSVASVPNIKDDFALPRRMPITDIDQGGPEVHDIGTGAGTQRGKDLVESNVLLGKGAPQNRHVECTDCHNPHRATKKRLFNADASTPDAAGTHDHGTGHTNLASGVLRGGTGVEPVYGSATFGSEPIAFDFKRGDGGVGASTAAGSPWVTREYQICLKCHSNYAYDTPPNLGDSGGGTPSGTNGLTQYTNQAMEFQAPLAHKGEGTTLNSGAFAGTPPGRAYTVNFQTNNHRGWHPVIDNTGRTNAIRGTVPGAFQVPWGGAADVGSQTMYCTDCHGSSTAANTVVPNGGEDGNPWGPHGSTNNFILKGEWSATTGTNSREGGFTANALCFKCHNPNNYADRNGVGSISDRTTGFFNSSKGNLHAYHTDKIQRLRCTWCHVAVPHGWKNKALLVNLNDVGPEVGLPAGTQVKNNTGTPYTNPPYYLNAVLKVRTFATSGNWVDTNCGSVGAPGNGASGRDWMRDSSENCANLP